MNKPDTLLTESVEVEVDFSARCPDFDIDCDYEFDPLKCFIGNEFTDGIAKGHCPLIHAAN